jgi:hypothetical protein
VGIFVPGKEQPVLNPARVEHEVGIQSCSISENSGHVKPPVVPQVNTYGAFAKRASSDGLSTSSSTFIVSGADGRGGRVTVLKPPSLSLVCIPHTNPSIFILTVMELRFCLSLQ